MPRLRWDRDSTFSGRHRASLQFRQRTFHLIQASIFARLTQSEESETADFCARPILRARRALGGNRTGFFGLRSRQSSLPGRCPHVRVSNGAAVLRLGKNHGARPAPPRKAGSRRDACTGREFRMNIKKLLDLSGRVAIITGGSIGLGRQMAEGLAEMGADVVLCARKEERCHQAAEELQQLGVKAIAVGCDVKNPDSVQEMVEATLSQFGRIDVLINNAGISWGAPVEEMRLEDWNKVIETNLTGTFLCARAVGKVMIRQGRGEN